MRSFKLTLEYEGGAYHGWQFQPGSETVQGVVEQKLALLLREPVRVHGAGRTDAGVHALGQVAHFYTHSGIESARLLRSLNGILPKNIAVRELEEVPLSFHSRFDATSKCYRYQLLVRKTRSALLYSRSWHLYGPLDVGVMEQEMRALVGRHDFAAFCAAGASTSTTVRTLYRAELSGSDQDLLTLTFEGNGFLKRMVRSLVGTLVDVGRGQLPAGHIKALLDHPRRHEVGKTAPPQGLTLMWVRYDGQRRSDDEAGDED